MHIYGRKHVLEHGGHEFDMHAILSKVIEDEQRMIFELLLVHPVLLQRWNDIFDKTVLKNKQKKNNNFVKVGKRQSRKKSNFGTWGTSVRLLWRTSFINHILKCHHLNPWLIWFSFIWYAQFKLFTLVTWKWSMGPLGRRATFCEKKNVWFD